MRKARSARANRYTRVIEHVFNARYRKGATRVPFERTDFEAAAQAMGITAPKNLGDILYTFRFRGTLPDSIRQRAPSGLEWIIRLAGRGRYEFVATKVPRILPTRLLQETKIPDSTPGVIELYSSGDEQALLAKIRYNRLVDILTGVAAYSLQNHFRTTVPEIGQIETDELYIGIDSRGAHYAFPLQAKTAKEAFSIVQVEQDFAMCANKFPDLLCRPIAAQFMKKDLVCMFVFEETDGQLEIAYERHYRLVPPEELGAEEIRAYRETLPGKAGP